MKVNKLTPGYNLMWESSRMIIPQHKEAIIRHQFASQKRKRPEFDEQFQRIIGYAIEQSYELQTVIKVSVFDEYEDIEHVGRIVAVDRHNKRIKLQLQNDEHEWIKVEGILLIDAL